MVNRFSKVFLGIFLFIISLYLALIIDTHDLMSRAKKIFLGEILKHDIEDELIRYDLNGYSNEKNEIGEVKLKLFRLFTLHNFKNGIIIVYYTRVVYSNENEIITGSWDIFPVIWKIQKINNIWNVVKIKERP
jgi:hypothetical protein